MLTKLQYLNFKSWQSTGELGLAPITGFFGANSSGKTSLLQAILLLKQTMEASDRNLALDFGGVKGYVDLGSFKEIIFKHLTLNSLNISISWKPLEYLKIEDPENAELTLFEGDQIQFSVEISGDGSLEVEKFSYSLGSNQFEMQKANTGYVLKYSGDNDFRFKKVTLRPNWHLPPPYKFYSFPDQVKSYFQNAGFLSDFQLELEKLLASIYYLGPLRDHPQRRYFWNGSTPEDMGRKGERAIEAILISDSQGRKISRGQGQKPLLLGEYVAFWLKELGLIHSFEIKGGADVFQVWVKKTPDSSLVLITDVGFGVSPIIPVITLCYYVPEGSVVIIEQPEIHLHPSVQSGLADVFIDAMQIRGIQIILESHSEHLLRRLQRRIAEEKLSAGDIALYFCEMAEGKSEIKPLNIDTFGNISNWPKDFFGDEFGEIAAINLAKLDRLQNA